MVRDGFNALAFISNCESEERAWHFLNMDSEVVLLANWYRPGASIHDGFEKIQEELGALAAQATGVIIADDLNVHHQRWLRFSNEIFLLKQT